MYMFSYYEWTLVYIIEQLEPGFVREYSREIPLTSGQLARRLCETIKEQTDISESDRNDLTGLHKKFKELVAQRNALIHAHPVTEEGGAQILNYQASTKRPISDLTWKTERIEEFRNQIDRASSRASKVFRQYFTPRAP